MAALLHCGLLGKESRLLSSSLSEGGIFLGSSVCYTLHIAITDAFSLG